MSLKTRFTQFYADLANAELDALSTLYAPDIIFTDPVATHKGIEQVKDYFSHLLDATKSCVFDIHHYCEVHQHNPTYDVVVEWTMTLELHKQSTPISVDGVSLLKVDNDLIHYHRDYYDMGQMVYEHVPLLKRIIFYIKRRLIQ